jgi:ParB/RepB/Spo0J family partition protein
MANTFKSPLQKAVVTWLAAHPAVSIAELGKRAEIDRGDLSKINSGQKHSLNMESAVRLAKALGTTVEGLIGQEPPPNAARGDIDIGARMIPLADIDPSPDNPRKAFDDEELGQLAASIAEQGLLQPIVVRPKGDRFEIVAGERRFRALKINHAAEALCLVREDDDEATTRALRIIENLQRADIKPVEEADAFLALAELDPKKWNATTIGKAIGMSDRFVAQRLSIARNLAPDLKEQLARGHIKIEQARALAAWPQQLQRQVRLHGWGDASDILNQMHGMVVPAARAAFDLKRYTGEIVKHDGEKFFADKDQVLKLQDEAAAALATSLSKDWPGARFIPKNPLTGAYVWADSGERIYRWSPKREPTEFHAGLAKPDVTAIVYVDDSTHEVVALKGVVLQETWNEKATGGKESEERAIEERREEEVGSAVDHMRRQLLDQMPSHAQLAQALFVYGAIGSLGHGLYIETDPKEYLEPWKAQLEGILDMNEHGWEPYDPPADGEDKLWAWLQTQGPEQIEQMFCRLMAVQVAPTRYRQPGAPHLSAYNALSLSIPEALQELYDEDEQRAAQLDADDDDLSEQLTETNDDEADAQSEAA